MKIALLILACLVAAVSPCAVIVAQPGDTIQVTGSVVITGSVSLSISVGMPTNPPPASTNIWAVRYGNTGSDGSFAVTINPSKEIINAGWFSGTISYLGTILTGGGGQALCLSKQTSSGALVWAKGYGGTGNTSPLTVKQDASGNIYTAGYFNGTVNLGGSNLVSNAGSLDMFLAKYDSNGNHVWSERFGTTNSDQISSIAIDSLGNVAVIGFFQGVLVVGTNSMTSVNNSVDTFFGKFNPNGQPIFARNFVNSAYDAGNGIAIDSSDNIIIGGYFKFMINLGGGNMTTASGNEIYLGKFTSAGVYIWQQKYGNNVARLWSLGVDPSGNIGITGDFSGTTDLGGGAIVGTAVDNDMFIAKYSGVNGTYVWGAPILGDQGCLPSCIVADSSGNFIATGYYYGVRHFAATTLTSLLGSYDVWVAKYSTAGALVSAQSFGGNTTDIGYGVAVGSDGYIATSGAFTSIGTFAGQSLQTLGSYDGFIQRIAP